MLFSFAHVFICEVSTVAQRYIIEEMELSREVKLVHSDNTVSERQSQDNSLGSWSSESMKYYLSDSLNICVYCT